MKTEKLTDQESEDRFSQREEIRHAERILALFDEVSKEEFINLVRENRNKLMISRAISTHSFDVPNNCYKDITLEECLVDFFTEWQHSDYLCATVFDNGTRKNRFFKKNQKQESEVTDGIFKAAIFLRDHES